MLARFREYYHDNADQLRKIDEFENLYDPEHILWWYSLPAYISDIINKALRALDISALYDLRYCIIDLCQALDEARENRPVSFTVYRGVLLPRVVFEETRHHMERGELISHCGFLSTSSDREVAIQFGMNDEGREDLVEILYEIEVPPNLNNVVCADISRFSSISNEEEILFDLDSTFELVDVIAVQESKNERYVISLRASDRGSELARKYIDENNREMRDLTEDILFGKLLADMGDSVQSELYFRLMERDRGSKMIREKRSVLITNIGRALVLRGDYDRALFEYDRALDLQLEEPPLKFLIACNIVNKSIVQMSQGYFEQAYKAIQNSLPTFFDFGELRFVGVTLLNMGMMVHQQGRYEEALDLLDNALEAMKEGDLNDDHDMIAEVILNIGKAKQGMGKLSQAMADFDKSLAIRKRFLPANHFDIGRTYLCMGIVKWKQNETETAVELLQRALPFYEKNFPEGHSDRTYAKRAIANVYVDQQMYDLALELYKECLIDCRHFYRDKHSTEGSILNNIGQVYSLLGNTSLALEYLQDALRIHETTLHPNHPDTASICLNLTLIISGNKFDGDLTLALNYAKRALEIRRATLSSDNILLSQTEEYVRILARFEARKYYFGHIGPDPDNPRIS
ncbi:unnamed protein product [Didymodactylos carnosus]|uniref:ADP ribosyltransferase domain-containing protein n=1 Tax=Didymodactylos carnosus TaxID=1234261 RepID=A0A813UH32_9BILA|nr:unnamed protein product [Didymodactylos carnosus]CAF3616063.1 unnamed protein product [Didymodactylos carnosus]